MSLNVSLGTGPISTPRSLVQPGPNPSDPTAPAGELSGEQALMISLSVVTYMDSSCYHSTEHARFGHTAGWLASRHGTGICCGVN